MKRLLTAFLLCMAVPAFSQLQPEFEFQPGNAINKIRWMQQANDGTLVAATDLSLLGIDPKTQKIAWEIKELGSAEEGKFENIPGTPYFLVETSKVVNLGTPQTSIIEAGTGKIIFNSKDAEMNIVSKRPLYEITAMLIEGKKNKRNFIALIDLNTGKEKWNKDLGEAKAGFGVGALVRKIKSTFRSLFAIPPMVDKDGNIIIVDRDEVYCLANTDGTERWRKEFKEKIEDAMLTYDMSSLFVSYDNRVDLLRVENGTSAYGEKLLKIKGHCNGLAPYDEKSYILKHSEGVNIIDASTGQLRWKKESELDDINDVRITEHGIIAINTTEKETKLYLVNNEGKKVWKFEISDPALVIEPTDKGILYFTKSRANLVDFAKGKELWKRDIKIRARPSFGFDPEHRKLLVYSGDKLNAFSLQDGNMTVLNEELPLKDYDEDKELASIETRSNGYFISSLQNTALVDFDGKIIYNTNFIEAGMRKGLRTALKVGSVAAGTFAFGNFIATPGKYMGKDISQTGNMLNAQRNAFIGGNIALEASGAVFEAASKRYHATQQVKDAVFILTRFQGTGIDGLVKIDKDSGKEVVRIPFGDKSPSYIVDEAENKLYVIIKDKFIQGYNLNTK